MASLLASSPDRQEILAGLTDAQVAELLEDWRFWARPEQIAPDGDWLTWVINAGRGFGKTRADALCDFSNRYRLCVFPLRTIRQGNDRHVSTPEMKKARDKLWLSDVW